MDTVRKTFRWLLPIVLTFVSVIALVAWSPAGATTDGRPHVHVRAVQHLSLDDTVFVEAPPDPRVTEMAAYIEHDVMERWTPAARKLQAADYHEVAIDLAHAVLARPSADPWKDGVLLAALGYFEGARYAKYVDDGSCNDPAWRKDPANAVMLRSWGDCDGGYAHSIFQIHPIVDPSSSLYGLCSLKAISDRRGAAECALAIARRSVDSTGSLSGYTGEDSTYCPKAEQRMKFALDAIEKHPFHGAAAR